MFVGTAVLALASHRARADSRFEVGGALEAGASRLEVRVDLTNRGAAAVAALAVEGELLGARDQGRIQGPLAPGATRSLRLRFPRDLLDLRRPGAYLVALSLDELDTEGRATSNQRGYLVLPIGANPAPAVRVDAADVELLDVAELPIRLQSADGAPHRVRFRVLTPRGLNAEPSQGEESLPASGSVSVLVRLLRGSVPRPSRPGLVVAAATLDGYQETTAVASASVAVHPDPAWLPRLRTPLFVAGLLLLVAAGGLEVARHRRRPS